MEEIKIEGWKEICSKNERKEDGRIKRKKIEEWKEISCKNRRKQSRGTDLEAGSEHKNVAIEDIFP